MLKKISLILCAAALTYQMQASEGDKTDDVMTKVNTKEDISKPQRIEKKELVKELRELYGKTYLEYDFGKSSNLSTKNDVQAGLLVTDNLAIEAGIATITHPAIDNMFGLALNLGVKYFPLEDDFERFIEPYVATGLVSYRELPLLHAPIEQKLKINPYIQLGAEISLYKTNKLKLALEYDRDYRFMIGIMRYSTP